MGPALAVTTTLLAVFSDDPDSQGLEDRVHRAILTQDFGLVEDIVDGLPSMEEKEKLLNELERWFFSADTLNNLMVRGNSFQLFCECVGVNEFYDRVFGTNAPPAPVFGGRRPYGFSLENLDPGASDLKKKLAKTKNLSLDFISLDEESAYNILSWDETKILLYREGTVLGEEDALFTINRDPKKFMRWREEWIEALVDYIERNP